jgi:hypothetical protein
VRELDGQRLDRHLTLGRVDTVVVFRCRRALCGHGHCRHRCRWLETRNESSRRRLRERLGSPAQIVGVDLFPVGADQGSGEDRLELGEVARPGMARERRDCGRREDGRGGSERRGECRRSASDENRQLGLAASQDRHVERDR